MVAHVNTSTGDVTSASTNVAFDLPSHSSGHLICADLAFSTPTSSGFTVTPTSDFTELFDVFISAASNAAAGSWYGLAPAGGFSTAITFTASESVGVSWVTSNYSDPDPTTPIASIGALNSGNSSAPQALATAIPNDNSIVRAVWANDDDDFLTVTATGMTLRGEAGAATPSNGRHIAVADEALSSGSSAAKTSNMAAEEWVAWQYVINPILTSYETSSAAKTKDDAGSDLASCDVFLINETNPPTFGDYVLSSTATGVYQFTGLATAELVRAIAFKDGSTDVMDVTDPLTPTET